MDEPHFAKRQNQVHCCIADLLVHGTVASNSTTSWVAVFADLLENPKQLYNKRIKKKNVEGDDYKIPD